MGFGLRVLVMVFDEVMIVLVEFMVFGWVMMMFSRYGFILVGFREVIEGGFNGG